MNSDLKTAQELISKSGNTFHSKVVQYLQEQGWTVLISPYYTDNITNKPREIDIIAEKAFESHNKFVNVQLFLECKYIQGVNVFWFHKKDDFKARSLVAKQLNLRRNNTYIEKFHYMDVHEKAAKLFASQKGKSIENEPFFKAINQILNAYLYFRTGKTIIQSEKAQNPHIDKFLHFPVIICSSFEKLFKTEMGQEGVPQKIAENFLLEVHYAYVNASRLSQTEYFLIDIVEYDQLEVFLEKIKRDAETTAFLMS